MNKNYYKKFICGNYYSWLDLITLQREFNNEEELWMDIDGYKGIYLISNFGKVRSLSNGRLRIAKDIKCGILNTGYKNVVLHNKKEKPKTMSVHRLVALHFIDNPKNLKCVNHKDGNKQNNHVNNLEWVTHSENIKHSVELRKSLRIF